MAQDSERSYESQKPEKVIQGMIAGRIKKELKKICLLDQVYVKAEDGKTVCWHHSTGLLKRTALRSQSKASFVMRPETESRRKKRTLLRKLQSRWVNNPLLKFSFIILISLNLSI